MSSMKREDPCGKDADACPMIDGAGVWDSKKDGCRNETPVFHPLDQWG